MKCPKCHCESNFQVIEQNNQKYAKCSKCGALLTSSDLRKNLKPSPPQSPQKTDSESKAKNEAASTTVAGVIVLIAIIFGVVKLFSGGSSDTDSKTADSSQQTETSKKETDAYGWTRHDYVEFMSITKAISNEYIANYKAPFLPDNWKFAKFDDEGRIMATTKYSFNNINEKQDMVCVFTRGEERDDDGWAETYTPHFLSVGDNIYVNDGSCNEFFQNLQNAMQYYE